MTEQTPQAFSYRRRGNSVLLKLCQTVTVADAAQAQQIALRAARDEKVKSLTLSVAAGVRIDTSALQILIALKQELVSSGRGFEVQFECMSGQTSLLTSGGAL